MLFTVDLLVLEEETLGLVGTLEVYQLARHGCTHLITTLEGKRTAWFKKALCTHNRRRGLSTKYISSIENSAQYSVLNNDNLGCILLQTCILLEL